MAEEKKPADNGRQGRVLLIKRDDKILSLLYSGNRLLRADACRADAEVLDHIYIGKVKNVKTNINAAFVEFTPGLSQSVFYSPSKTESRVYRG